MRRLFRGLGLAVAVLTGLAAVPVRAEESGVINIDDKAGLFSDDGIAKAKHAFESTTFKSKTHLLVVTADHVPPKKQAEWDEIVKNKDDKGRNRFAEEWARAMGRTQDSHGDIVVLVYRSPAGGFFVSTVSDKQADVHRHFSDTKAREVDGIFLRELRKVKTEKLDGAAAKKEMDSALVSATELIIKELKDTSAPDSSRKAAAGNNHVAADQKAGGGIGGYICMILMVVLGAWLVIGLIRAFTGGGGGGGPGGGYGGGGGGFFTSLMGGMFGAMAGMWMYNNLFGGHDYHNDAMAGDNYGNESGDTGDGNYDDGAAATDGDWGDSGGGDWGDSGGGGDWGGGGGDFGGGGDW
ncbi:MAG: hypothetical protein KF873_08015 [Gemmataceae bacterium]|nr:hypothetical protein [Planctomycetia bacterium]MBX3398669.1 hypothetical protein [Gemmataceae bacterium]